MKRVINFSLNNKFAVWLLTILVAASGIFAGFKMKMETIPDINTPLVMVSTVYPGATPEDIAENITKPIEQKIKNNSGVKNVVSSSFQNVSSIQIEYGFSKDMDKAQKEVEEAMASVDLPEQAQKPDVSRLNLNDFPILSLSASSGKDSLEDLTKLIEEDMVPELEGIEGVANVEVSGQYAEEVQLKFKQKELEERGLDEETVQQLLQGAKVKMPLGLYTFGNEEKSVVIDGNIASVKDLQNVEIPYTPAPPQAGPGTMDAAQGGMSEAPVGMDPGAMGQSGQGAAGMAQGQGAAGQTPSLPTVKLKELADIKVVAKHESISRTNGEDSLGVQIVKSPDANTVEVADAVQAKVDDIKKKNKDLHVETIMDQATPIKDSVETMVSKAIIGAIFAIVIIMLFLRNIRSTAIAVISIPLSLLMALLVLKQMDVTLNVMTLGALTVAIGRVVDDSIVVIENIYRRLSIPGERLRGKELIREATLQMFKPIMSSTIVTIAVFIPLGLVKGPVGELFLPFALAIVFALAASLLVAITIVPAFADTLFKKGVKRHKEEHGKLSALYERVLRWSLNHKLITFGLAVAVLIGSFFLVPLIGVSFLPSEEEKMVMATYSPEPGQTLDEVEKQAGKAEDYFMDRKNVETMQYSVGGGNPMNPGDTKSALFFVEYHKDTKDFTKEQEKVIADLNDMSDAGEWKSMDFGAGFSNSTELLVYGNDLESIRPTVEELTDILKENKDLKNVDSSLSQAYDQYTLLIDQKKLAEAGLTAGQVGMELSNVGDRTVLTTVQEKGKELDVYLEVDEKNYKNIDELRDTKVQSPLGTEVALKDVTKLEEGESPDTVTKRNGKVYATVSGDIVTDDVGKVTADVQKQVSGMDLPKHVEIEQGGIAQDIDDSFTQLGLAMLAAVAIVYFVLVVTFGGALAPFAILFSLPFTIIGGLLALLISGETLSISAMIGALMLIGIVVTNAIVLIDRVIHQEQAGLSVREALIEAGKTRLRPILMTALATIGALLPLAFGFENGGLISKGLGVTVIGGLVSSTLLTLLIVPIVYEFLMKFSRKKKTTTES